MAMLRNAFLIFTAVLFALIAYIAYEPVPEGIEQPLPLKLHLASSRATINLCMLLPELGFDVPCGSVVHGISSFFKSIGLVQTMDISQYAVTTKDTVFDDVPVRVYTPHDVVDSKPSRAVVFFHGGGWILGSVAAYNNLCTRMAHDLKAVVISVEYRLAPKHVFPAAMDDCFTAAKYVLKNAGKLNSDKTRISIMGDSAGGNLAAAVTQRLKDERMKPMPKMQVLIYPVLQATDFDTPSYRANKDGPLLTQKFMVWAWAQYIFGAVNLMPMLLSNNHTHPHFKQKMPLKYMKLENLPKDSVLKDYKAAPPFTGNISFWNEHKELFLNPYLAPLMTGSDDISGLPMTYISSCQYDILRDESFHYAARLREHNVHVHSVNLDKCFHGWFDSGKIANNPTFRQHYLDLIKFLDKNL